MILTTSPFRWMRRPTMGPTFWLKVSVTIGWSGSPTRSTQLGMTLFIATSRLRAFISSEEGNELQPGPDVPLQPHFGLDGGEPQGFQLQLGRLFDDDLLQIMRNPDPLPTVNHVGAK